MRKKSFFIAAVLCFVLMAVPVMVQASEEEAASLFEQAVTLMEAGEYEDALVPLIEAADMGDAHAQDLLGECYYMGIGVEQDFEEAFRYFQQAAQQGVADALRILGDLYHDGYGVEQSYEKAVEYLEQAAQQGNVSAYTALGLSGNRQYRVHHI